MIRGQIELSREQLEVASKSSGDFSFWLMLAQEQLVSLPSVARYDDLEDGNFPIGEGYFLLIGPVDLYTNDTDNGNWVGLREGDTYAYGVAIPTTYTPPVEPDPFTHPVGSVRLIHNNTGGVINTGVDYSGGLRIAVITGAGPTSTPGGSVSGTWRSFAKFSNLEASEMVRVS